MLHGVHECYRGMLLFRENRHTCAQSSVVGASTMTRGELRMVRLLHSLFSSSRMRCTRGSKYASVFPLPAHRPQVIQQEHH